MMNRASMRKQITSAPGKAAGRGSAKGQEMRGFPCGGKVKKYAKGGKIDGIAKRGRTNCKIC